jgi:O-antigen ligase
MLESVACDETCSFIYFVLWAWARGRFDISRESLVNFGLEAVAGWVLYGAGILAFILSITWRPIAGIYYLVPLIPLQTTRSGLDNFPLGGNIVVITMLGVILGLLRRRQPIFAWTPWNASLGIYSLYIFASLVIGSFYLNDASLDPQRLTEWKDYMLMPLMLFLVAAAVGDVRNLKVVVALICLGVFLVDKSYWGTVSGRDFSSYSENLREAGAMGYAGANGLGAFEAQCSAFLIALGGFERKRWLKVGYFALGVFSAVCLMFSLSRGGYAAILAGWLFIGLVKQRKMLVLLIVFGMIWTSVVPSAVSSRVFMTYDPEGELDHSAETRVTLWEDAMRVFDGNQIFGTGYNTYAYMGRVGTYKDTHNYFIKMLVETGVVGMFLFIWLLGGLFGKGYQLFRGAQDPFLASLGFALAAWMICVVVGNAFGDRWNYLQVNGYMWVIAGLVARGWVLEKKGVVADSDQDHRLSLQAAHT